MQKDPFDIIIKKAVSIKTLKVWEETEKHLGWIANKKADISFSSVITASKLKNADVKMPIVFVWDNFSILTRGYMANGLEDVKGKAISVLFFEDAPPAKISKYLIQAKGLKSKDFEFGLLSNAGVVIKGEFIRKYPEIDSELLDMFVIDVSKTLE